MINPAKYSAVILIVAMLSCAQPSSNKAPDKTAPTITCLALELPSGWGYSIYRDGKLFIRQEAVPAVAGSIPFASERDAAAVAEEVVKKLNMGASPRITVEDLQRLSVKY